VCLHFCAFRRAGSNLRDTHVHFLPPNPKNISGLGHDDETDNTNKGHVSVSDKDGCKVSAEDDDTMALRVYESSLTAYFHPADADGTCDKDFRRIRCRCRNAEGPQENVWVCYTFDHRAWRRWYDEVRWTNRTGRYELDATQVANIPQGKTLDCPSSILIEASDTKNVPNCTGYGAADKNNPLLTAARAELQQAANRITCTGPCTKGAPTETFVGWRCGQDREDGPFSAEAKVQWRVECKK
jgi:hypothetical protein